MAGYKKRGLAKIIHCCYKEQIYVSLTQEEDGVTMKFDKLIQANKQAAEELIPIAKKGKRNKIACQPCCSGQRKNKGFCSKISQKPKQRKQD